jgi:hypothetical protein
MSISALVEKAARRADQEQAPAADPVAERAHRDQRAGDHESIDVDDPQELRAARLQIGAEVRHRQMQHGEIHGVEEAWKGDHDQPDPLAARRPGCLDGCFGHGAYADKDGRSRGSRGREPRPGNLAE